MGCKICANDFVYDVEVRSFLNGERLLDHIFKRDKTEKRWDYISRLILMKPHSFTFNRYNMGLSELLGYMKTFHEILDMYTRKHYSLQVEIKLKSKQVIAPNNSFEHYSQISMVLNKYNNIDDAFSEFIANCNYLKIEIGVNEESKQFEIFDTMFNCPIHGDLGFGYYELKDEYLRSYRSLNLKLYDIVKYNTNSIGFVSSCVPVDMLYEDKILKFLSFKFKQKKFDGASQLLIDIESIVDDDFYMWQDQIYPNIDKFEVLADDTFTENSFMDQLRKAYINEDYVKVNELIEIGRSGNIEQFTEYGLY